VNVYTSMLCIASPKFYMPKTRLIISVNNFGVFPQNLSVSHSISVTADRQTVRQTTDASPCHIGYRADH